MGFLEGISTFSYVFCILGHNLRILFLSSKVKTYMVTCFLVKFEDEIKTLFDNFFFSFIISRKF